MKKKDAKAGIILNMLKIIYFIIFPVTCFLIQKIPVFKFKRYKRYLFLIIIFFS